MGINIQNLTGQRLGQFGLKRLLGTGGMSAVYLAYQINLKRHVAVKVLRQELAEREQYKQRFTEEAEIAAKLTHPNIVPVYDFGFSEGISYIAMRLLIGGSLWDRMRDHVAENMPVCSLSEAAELLRQIGGALDYAHKQGVIHRDIKPSNIMFDDQGNAFLVDFGIAVLQDKLAKAEAEGAQNDEANTVMGTYAYIAPEMWQGDKITPAIDQYALGLIMYTLITGEAPFDVGPNEEHRMRHKHVYEMPVPAHLVRSEIPPSVTEVLERAMAKRGNQRFTTCLGFAEAFETAIRNVDSNSPRRFDLPSSRARVLKKMLGDEATPSFPQSELSQRAPALAAGSEPLTPVPAPAPRTPTTDSVSPYIDVQEETRVAVPGERILNMLTDEHLTRNIGRPPADVNLIRARLSNQDKMQLFISYRNDDSGQTADQILARFRKHFGAKTVISQREDIHIGTNVKKHYRDLFKQSTVLVLVIGKFWLDSVDQFGNRKIERLNDTVRAALEAAIEADLPVIPVYVDGVTGLKVEQLPASIRDMIYHSDAVVRSDDSFDEDVSRLIRQIEVMFEQRQS